MYPGRFAMRRVACSQPLSLPEDFSHYSTTVLPSSWVTLSELFHFVNNVPDNNVPHNIRHSVAPAIHPAAELRGARHAKWHTSPHGDGTLPECVPKSFSTDRRALMSAAWAALLVSGAEKFFSGSWGHREELLAENYNPFSTGLHGDRKGESKYAPLRIIRWTCPPIVSPTT
jgi:hypothetical protein